METQGNDRKRINLVQIYLDSLYATTNIYLYVTFSYQTEELFVQLQIIQENVLSLNTKDIDLSLISPVRKSNGSVYGVLALSRVLIIPLIETNYQA